MKQRTSVIRERRLEPRERVVVEGLRAVVRAGMQAREVVVRGCDLEDAVAVERDSDVDVGFLAQLLEEAREILARLERELAHGGRQAFDGRGEHSRCGARCGAGPRLVDDDDAEAALRCGECRGEAGDAAAHDDKVGGLAHVRASARRRHLAASAVMESISLHSRACSRGARETSFTRGAYGGQTRTGDRTMLATIFMIGLFALAGLFLLKLVFGLGFGLLGWLFGFAIKALICGAVIYLVIPDFQSGDGAAAEREVLGVELLNSCGRARRPLASPLSLMGRMSRSRRLALRPMARARHSATPSMRIGEARSEAGSAP